MQSYSIKIIILLFITLLSGCGGGGSSDLAASPAPASPASPAPAAPAPAPTQNNAPVVTSTSPNEADILSETSVELLANVSDTDGTIVSVTFSVTAGGDSLFEDEITIESFTKNWDLSDVADGDYAIEITVKDDDGAETSVTVNVTVDKPEPVSELPPSADPPFTGTIFLNQNIIKNNDQTTFVSTSFEGTGSRQMFDRRVNAFITLDAFLFSAAYDDGKIIEVQVNPEFGNFSAAQVEADLYAEAIGRLPSVLLVDVETVWIHKGLQPFGGGNNNILIHTDQGVLYENDGILEETLVHEASHTSLDAAHSSAPDWILAQTEDNNSISTYARDNPAREDIAETFLVYLAIRFRTDRISTELEQTILETVPNRITYFDNQSFNMYPIR